MTPGTVGAGGLFGNCSVFSPFPMGGGTFTKTCALKLLAWGSQGEDSIHAITAPLQPSSDITLVQQSASFSACSAGEDLGVRSLLV